MVVDAVASGAAPDVWLVPCSVTYETNRRRVVLRRERRGTSPGSGWWPGEHHEARPQLGSRFGQLYMKFGEPVNDRLAAQGRRDTARGWRVSRS